MAAGTMSCIGICMANGEGMLCLTALNFFKTGTFKHAGSTSFCMAKRHITAWFPAFWRVQFGMATGSCLDADWGVGEVGAGDKGKVKE